MTAAKKKPTSPLLLRRKAAAEYLGLSVAAFWRMEQSGEIPAGHRLPGQKRGTWWHRDELAKLADRWMVRP